MMNKLILKRKDGSEREVKWGMVPDTFDEPIYWETDAFGRPFSPDAVSSTLGRRRFYLQGKKLRGFWIFKYFEAYYEEE